MSESKESMEEVISLLISTLVRKERATEKHLAEIQKEIDDLKEKFTKIKENADTSINGMWVTRKLLAEAMQDYTDWSVDRVAKKLGLI